MGGGAKDFGGFGAGEGGYVDEPDEGFDAGGGSDGDGEAVEVEMGVRVAERGEGVLDPADGPAAAEGGGGVGVGGE